MKLIQSPSFVMFFINVIVATAFIALQLTARPAPDPDAIGFALASIAWGIALMVQEATASFRIRLLEREKRELEQQIGKNSSALN